VIEGYLDSLADGYVQGWARDTRKPSEPASVTVHCNGRPVGSTAADIYRADLKQAGYGEGKHGFAFYLPDGLEGDLTVWVNGTQLPGAFRAPHLLSEVGPHQRSLLAKNYLHGEGIEIGALDSPLRAPPGVKIRTVDRLPTEELRAHYSFPKAVPVEYVCDAQTLEGIASDSQDFVIANHVFEHMENPVGALENWVRVLRPGGFVFMAIPDKRYTFDVDRTITPLAHILEEYHDPEKLAANRLKHFEEWVRQVEHETSGVEERIAFLMQISYSIHFHCWTGKELCELFESVSWIGFELDCFKANRPENIYLLRKLGSRSNSPGSGILGSKVTGFLQKSFARAKLQRLTGLARRVYGRTPPG
jgi:SAM-dependent methyltransferase